MTKGQTQVADFMRFFGQATPTTPTLLDEKTAKLRAGLMLEEILETITKGLGLAIELIDASGDRVRITEFNLSEWMKPNAIHFEKLKEVNLKELTDGLADSAYVGEFGTSVAIGVDLEPIQDIVHVANMSKAWTEEQLEEAKRLHPEARIEKYSGNLYRLIRPDGKVIKSPYFQDPADLIAAEIQRQSQ